MTDISTKKILFFDRGYYTFIAKKLAESFGKVYYYFHQSEAFPKSNIKHIGNGITDLDIVDDFWNVIDKVDAIVFMGCYDGSLQHWLRKKGYRVFGSGLSEKVELDREYLLDCLTEIGLPVPKTYKSVGLDNLRKHLTGKSDKWLKRSYFRGDFETYHFKSMKHLDPWIDDLRKRIGNLSEDIEILVQNTVDSECEIGYDGFCVDGEFVNNNCLLGYEVKDKGYLGKIMDKPSNIVKSVNDKMSSIFKHHGYRGHYSSEIRITKNGKAFFMDATCRAPLPPSELMTEMYKNYADIVWNISGGEVPVLEPIAKYGAETILYSSWNITNELCVEFPDDISKYVKLYNQTRRGGNSYIIPNNGDGAFGAAIGIGKTVKEAIDMCIDVASQIKADELEYDKNLISEIEEKIKSGEEHGINFK
jgi:hypothetical protein